jgi:hypothetical protein
VAIAAVVAEATAAVLLAGVGAAAIAAVARVMVVVAAAEAPAGAAEVVVGVEARTAAEADRTGPTNFLDNFRARPDLPGGLFVFRR